MTRMTAILLALCLGSAQAQYPLPPMEDRVRLAEAFALADAVQDKVWADWGTVPFVVLLLTPDFEYLFRHPAPPDDFLPLGRDPISNEAVFARPNPGNYSLELLATFPAVAGVNTVVIGQAGNTGKSSSDWVVTALHEHFHQYQFTRPWYYEKVAALDLSDGDESGMWQLNFPYPYAEPGIATKTRDWAAALRAALVDPGFQQTPSSPDPAAAKGKLLSTLDSRNRRYLAFQLWQEGVARYTEHKVAELAAQLHEPSPEFAALDDFVPYDVLYQDKMNRLEAELAELDPAQWGRVAFYPLGAVEALLLDRSGAEWKTGYWQKPFEPLETKEAESFP